MKAINIIKWSEDSDLHVGKTELNGWHEFKAYGNIDFCTRENLAIVDSMVAWFAENEERLYSLVCNYVNENYEELLEESEFMDVFDEESPTWETNVGEVSEEDMNSGDIFKLMQISKFVLHNPEKNVVGVSFECAWDEEHGFGLVIQGDEVILQGGEQEAYHSA
ncbi:hypothetical protein ABT56_12240 [Photobacterium aquae]|uniref:DUF6985 domain-containing protein n=1 Tax=Photobacterium aquae TaxID=1195763 RepID=A0A0J1H0W6_9GAMM|nr:hypothetical protein [Photobacterium aquae]KLV05466.1 hypothetical protein ABT56_12240 [Photobacterium aquae]